MVGLSAFAGACLYDPAVSAKHIYAVLTAVFLGAGTSALNQFQERREDALMNRTSHRPIPSGAMSPFSVLSAGLFFTLLSAWTAFLTGNPYVFVIVFVTVIFYNFIYTPLKKLTPFALLAGSVTGSIPPVLGYTAAGGYIFSREIMLVALIMYIWQTPHFAMLAEKYADDYKRAGFKTLSSQYGARATSMFIKTWNTAFICSLFLVPLSSTYASLTLSTAHTALTALTALMLVIFYKRRSAVFHILNLCMVIFFLMLVIDRIIL